MLSSASRRAMSRLAGGVQLDRSAVGASSDQSGSSRPSSTFWRQHPPDGAVDQGLVDPAGLDLVQQRFAVTEVLGSSTSMPAASASAAASPSVPATRCIICRNATAP